MLIYVLSVIVGIMIIYLYGSIKKIERLDRNNSAMLNSIAQISYRCFVLEQKLRDKE